jgi:hypothetical protein
LWLCDFFLQVCDINDDYERSLSILAQYSPLLMQEGYIVLTLKMPKRAQRNIEERAKHVAESFPKRINDANYVVLRVFWLLANLNERCLVAQKK